MKLGLFRSGIALALMTSTLFGQGGSLTPPAGPPTPSLKSLDLIDPRTPLVTGAPGVSIILSGAIGISQPGSYYLTKNLTVAGGHGITIAANDVTLDLCGFTVSSTAASPTQYGILIQGHNVTVYNGNIASGITYNPSDNDDPFTGSGFGRGLYASSNFRNIRVRNLSVRGCDSHGVYCEDHASSIVESCTVSTAGGDGISAGVVQGCVVSECGGVAIRGSAVFNCRGESVGNDAIIADVVGNCYGMSTASIGKGIQASGPVTNSYGTSSGGAGIMAQVVSNSYGQHTGSTHHAWGIKADQTVHNSYGSSLKGPGIEAIVVNSSRGVKVTTPDSIIATIAVASDGFVNAVYKFLMP